jgi:DNA-binding GntR family transcriptional regulator
MMLSQAPAPLKEKAYSYLKEAIISGEIVPGSPISEYRLAEVLGISRTPVREALNQLELEGFLTSIPGKGMLVRAVTAEFVLEIFEYREAIEGFACRLAAMRMSEATRSELVNVFLRTTPPQDIESLLRIGDSLHSAVRNACANSTLESSLDRVRDHVKRLRLLAAKIPQRAERSFVEHQRIIEALADNDADLAETMMRDHIRSTRDSLLDTRSLVRTAIT